MKVMSIRLDWRDRMTTGSRKPTPNQQLSPEMQQRLQQRRAELAAAQNPPPPPDKLPEASAEKTNEKTSTRGLRIGTALLIFIASLMGTLIGAAADLTGALDTFNTVQRAFAPQLCLVGSNTILGDGIPMAAEWEAEFEGQKLVNVSINGIGSVRGVEEAIAGGCVHILAMSEPMTDTQYIALTNAGVQIDCAAPIGYDVIAFISDISNDIPAIIDSDLSRILNGRIRYWLEIGGENMPITILARPGSGTTELILSSVGRYVDPIIGDNDYFPPGANYIACDSNGNCLDQTLATPGSLYWVSAAWMRTQPPQYLRVIPIVRRDEYAINPLEDEVNLNNYPPKLIRPLYFYVLGGERINPEQNKLAREFLTYVRGVNGQQILEGHHFYTYFDRLSEVETILPPGFDPLPNGSYPVCIR